MVFAVRHRPPPPLMAQISRHFFTPLFSFAIESYIWGILVKLVICVVPGH